MYNYAFITNRKEVINEFNPTGKPIILMLRGLSRSYKAWLGTQYDLSENYDILCIDLPGVGLSKDEKLLYSVYSMAEKISEVINYLEIEKLYIVAPSLGSMITWEITKKLQISKIQGLVIIVPSHSGIGLRRISKKGIKTLLKLTSTSNDNEKILLLKDLLIGKTTDGRDIFQDDIEIEKAWKECILQDSKELGAKGQIAQLFAAAKYYSREALDYVKINRIPLKFIVAENDNLIPLKHQLDIYEYVKNPNSSLVSLKNSGHDFIVTHKREIIEIITNFVEDKNKFNNLIPVPEIEDNKNNKTIKKITIFVGLLILGLIIRYLFKKRKK
jgi:pimeloyl-ACP methyl ester carboxylesterase